MDGRGKADEFFTVGMARFRLPQGRQGGQHAEAQHQQAAGQRHFCRPNIGISANRHNGKQPHRQRSSLHAFAPTRPMCAQKQQRGKRKPCPRPTVFQVKDAGQRTQAVLPFHPRQHHHQAACTQIAQLRAAAELRFFALPAGFVQRERGGKIQNGRARQRHIDVDFFGRHKVQAA